MSTFPSILTSYTDPAPTNRLNSPSHSSIESAQNSGLTQLEAVIGVAGASSVVGTYEYLIKSPASDGGGHVQSANKGGTGQTSFNKGDILVATSSSVLSKLAVGLDGTVLTADSSVASGIKWGSSPAIPNIKVYGYSSSVITWNKPSVLSYVIVEVQGGGGGGAGNTTIGRGSPGGGGGGYARKKINASILSLTEQVWVGVGGTAGAAEGDGGTGGTTIFGTSSLVSATGGTGGLYSNGDGGTGGIGTNGDFNVRGGGGGGGKGALDVPGGIGGSAVLGGGGLSSIRKGSTTTGGVFGGGGAGAFSDDGDDVLGGAGGAGVVIVTEY